MKFYLGLAFILLSLLSIVAAQPQNCKGTPNLLPIGEKPPKLIRQIVNGSLYEAGDVNPPIKVVHMWGDAYQQGYAQGALLADVLPGYLEEVLEYVYQQIDEVLEPYLPPAWRHVIEVKGTAAVLDLTYDLTKPYIPQYFLDECKGIADGAKVDYKTVLRLSLFPELIQAHCSMVGAWAGAIADVEGTLYQLRALDWSTDGPFQKQPVLLVYHNEPARGNSYAVVGYAGLVGAFTGYSNAPMGICEKVWLAYEGKQSRVGIPWTYLLRDILQWDHTVEQALQRIDNAHRTCSIFIGLGDASPNFNIVQYSHEVVRAFNNTNQPSWQAHPSYAHALYVDKHKQPSNDPCLGSLVGTHYGALNATCLFQQIAAVHQTGDTHAAVYDYMRNQIYVSNAGIVPPGSPPGTEGEPAYNRPYTKFDMTEIFSLKAPDM